MFFHVVRHVMPVEPGAVTFCPYQNVIRLDKRRLEYVTHLGKAAQFSCALFSAMSMPLNSTVDLAPASFSNFSNQVPNMHIILTTISSAILLRA